ncbi:MAG: HEAT repeat domain-containing protein [Deltaproteobacteria bacterium]|nr:HEAT repeat domain-containing protein [Deltaproteobacteria bacterium]
MRINYCIHCFAEIAPEVRQCPFCGVEFREWARSLDYETRLIHTLGHPLADVRMRAIIALGKRGDPQAADPMVRCALRHPIDVVEGLEIVDGLRRLRPGGARSKALDCLARDHPAHAVRQAAAEALAGMVDEKSR